MSIQTIVAHLADLANPKTRQAIRANPRQYAIAQGIIASDSQAEVRVVSNTWDTFHLTITLVDHAIQVDAENMESIFAAGQGTPAVSNFCLWNRLMLGRPK